jgi:hypothetical protein
MTTVTFNPITLTQFVNWDDSTIWSPSVVPNGADVDVVIPEIRWDPTSPSPYWYQIAVGGYDEIRSLVLQGNELDVGSALSVSGDLDEEASGQIQLSGSLSAGSLELHGLVLQGYGSINVAGAITVDSEIIAEVAINAASLTMTSQG